MLVLLCNTGDNMEIAKLTFLKSFHLVLKIYFLLSFIILLSSCTTITDTLYVQDVNVKGPINQPPLRVTKKDTAAFTISPKVFINSKRDYNGLIKGHTKVNSEGFFQVDTFSNENGITYRETPGVNVFEFEGENLHWSLPDYFVGLDIDLPISRRIVLSGGFNFSSKDKTNLYGYRVGLGFLSSKDNIGIRIDGGIIWQKYTFEAASVVIRNFASSSESEVLFFRDRESSVNINHYFSLTINTVYEDLPVNFLLNLGYSGQSLIDYKPRDPDYDFYLQDTDYRVEDMRGEAYAAFFNASPGMYVNLNEWSRLVFAVRFFFEIDIEDSESSTFIIPMFQFDLSL